MVVANGDRCEVVLGIAAQMPVCGLILGVIDDLLLVFYGNLAMFHIPNTEIKSANFSEIEIRNSSFVELVGRVINYSIIFGKIIGESLLHESRMMNPLDGSLLPGIIHADETGKPGIVTKLNLATSRLICHSKIGEHKKPASAQSKCRLLL